MFSWKNQWLQFTLYCNDVSICCFLGWWFASKGEEEGWVPCGYLEPVSTDSHEEDNEQMSATGK